VLKNLFESIAPPERILCLGLGSLDGDNLHLNRVSRIQLVFLLEIKRLLVNVCIPLSGLTRQVPVIAYDPVFTHTDIELLESFDVAVEVLFFGRDLN
jgi:hypothetical protein